MTVVRERPVGTSTLTVPAVGLGCNNFGWRIDEEQTRAVLDAAIDAGVTFLDTAESYGGGLSEEFMGRALDGRRDQVLLATKFGWGAGLDDNSVARGTRAYVREAIERSLTKLRTDHVDLYQYHRPDGVTPIEETLGAMNELVDEGKVRFVGVSNFTAAMMREADAAASAGGLARPVSVQNEYSWLARSAEADVVPACLELGWGLIPYLPLASGLLTGKVRRGGEAPAGTRLAERGVRLPREDGVPDAAWDRIEAMERWAGEHGVTLLDVAIGGLAAMPAVCSVIAGATSPEQVRANAAAGGWAPTDAQLAELAAL